MLTALENPYSAPTELATFRQGPLQGPQPLCERRPSSAQPCLTGLPPDLKTPRRASHTPASRLRFPEGALAGIETLTPSSSITPIHQREHLHLCLVLAHLRTVPADNLDTALCRQHIYRKYNHLILDILASCCEHLLFMTRSIHKIFHL